jgi:thiol-disulfide isomerase/thioredoxin
MAAGACSHQSFNTQHERTPILSGPPNTTYPLPPLKGNEEVGWILQDEQHVKLSAYQGKVIVLDFYATWCEPCRESIPHLIDLQNRYGPQGVQVIGLNVGGPDDRVKVATFAREFSIQYPLGFPNGALTSLFISEDDTIPQTLVFNRKGQVVQRFVGYSDAMLGDLERTIQTSLAITAN